MMRFVNGSRMRDFISEELLIKLWNANKFEDKKIQEFLIKFAVKEFLFVRKNQGFLIPNFEKLTSAEAANDRRVGVIDFKGTYDFRKAVDEVTMAKIIPIGVFENIRCELINFARGDSDTLKDDFGSKIGFFHHEFILVITAGIDNKNDKIISIFAGEKENMDTTEYKFMFQAFLDKLQAMSVSIKEKFLSSEDFGALSITILIHESGENPKLVPF